MTTYEAPFAKHVTGQWDPEKATTDGNVLVSIVCNECKAATAVQCPSGRYRTHVDKFAVMHLHRDPFE